MPDKKSHFSPQIQSQNDINVFPLAILSEKSPKDPTRTSSAGRSAAEIPLAEFQRSLNPVLSGN